MLKAIPKEYFDGTRGSLKLLWEEEWRALGITQSLGWEHYEVHEPEPHILLFKYVHVVDGANTMATKLTMETGDFCDSFSLSGLWETLGQERTVINETKSPILKTDFCWSRRGSALPRRVVPSATREAFCASGKELSRSL
jgi:cyclin-dependent kinase regulatory subunit CKS1